MEAAPSLSWESWKGGWRRTPSRRPRPPVPFGRGEGRLSSDFSVTPFSRSFRDAKRPWGSSTKRVAVSPFEPDHNVLPFLTAHFRKRLGDQEWMVHDLKRSIAALCREGRVGYARVEAPGWLLRSPSLRDAPDGFYAEEEERFQDLWKGFFRSIAIESRKNLKLQRQFMPKKYQKYLLEKEELPGASLAKGLKRGFEG